MQPIGKELLAQFLAPGIFRNLDLPNELHVGGGKVREAVSVNTWYGLPLDAVAAYITVAQPGQASCLPSQIARPEKHNASELGLSRDFETETLRRRRLVGDTECGKEPRFNASLFWWAGFLLSIRAGVKPARAFVSSTWGVKANHSLYSLLYRAAHALFRLGRLLHGLYL